MKKLKIDDISADNSTQVRCHLDAETVQSYADAMISGTEFPPIVVFDPGDHRHIIADGWHRYFACKQSGIGQIAADIRRGSREDALRYALGANTAHGLRRTNADKRRAVKIAIEAWPDWTATKIAEVCGVSHTFVDGIKVQFATNANSPAITSTVKGKDGKDYPARKPRAVKAQQRKESEPEPDSDFNPEPPPEPDSEIESPHVQTLAQIAEAEAEKTREILDQIRGIVRAAGQFTVENRNTVRLALGQAAEELE